ncbi:predicted protein [Arabidopsis lyrata subsp. lyrata]|uniref:Predicted protein n=1 Tax=Arabidopsis lyrata subsp. lyrata TaxID=81972 RepID=D7KYN7_ARALL|nr:predicted protein [Arabidopsis lyrata subsp. lyrata]
MVESVVEKIEGDVGSLAKGLHELEAIKERAQRCEKEIVYLKDVVNIWYGRWSRPHKSLIRDFLNSISDAKAPSPSVTEWWRTASLYADQTGGNVSRSVLIAGEYSDSKYSHGQHLTRLTIQDVIASAARSASFPVDHKNGMNAIFIWRDKHTSHGGNRPFFQDLIYNSLNKCNL